MARARPKVLCTKCEGFGVVLTHSVFYSRRLPRKSVNTNSRIEYGTTDSLLTLLRCVRDEKVFVGSHFDDVDIKHIRASDFETTRELPRRVQEAFLSVLQTCQLCSGKRRVHVDVAVEEALKHD